MNYSDFKKYGISLNEDEINKFNLYEKLLLEWNEKFNLTRIIKHDEVLEKHFLDSLIPFFKISDLNDKSIIDIGSGAGFPGIPLKICFPNISLVMVESNHKKTDFLDFVVKSLNLDNVTIINDRAENLSKNYRETFDIATGRAVAPLNILIELSSPLIKVGGLFIALRGKDGEVEYNNANHAIKELSLSLLNKDEYILPSDGKRINFYFQKREKTKLKFPREYALISKKPL